MLSGPGVFFVRRFLVVISTSFADIGKSGYLLFFFFLTNSGSSCLSRNSSILYKLSNL